MTKGYNPFRDKDGQFASGPSGGSKSSAREKEDKANMKRAKALASKGKDNAPGGKLGTIASIAIPIALAVVAGRTAAKIHNNFKLDKQIFPKTPGNFYSPADKRSAIKTAASWNKITPAQAKNLSKRHKL